MKIKNNDIRNLIKEEIFRQILTEEDYFETEADESEEIVQSQEPKESALPSEIVEKVKESLSLFPSAEYLGARANIKINKNLEDPITVEVSIGEKFPTETQALDLIIDLERELNSLGVAEKITILPDDMYTIYFGSSAPTDTEIISMVS